MRDFNAKIKELNLTEQREIVLDDKLLEQTILLFLEDESDVAEVTHDEVMVYATLYFLEELVESMLKVRDLVRQYSLMMALSTVPERIKLKDQMFKKEIIMIQNLEVFPLKILLPMYDYIRTDMINKPFSRMNREYHEKLIDKLIEYEINCIKDKLLDSHSILFADGTTSLKYAPPLYNYGYVEISDDSTSDFTLSSETLNCKYLGMIYNISTKSEIWNDLLTTIQDTEKIFVISNYKYYNIKNELFSSLSRIIHYDYN